VLACLAQFVLVLTAVACAPSRVTLPEPVPEISPSGSPTPSAAIPHTTSRATAASLRVEGWSPDSQWLAFRTSTQAQVDAAPGGLPEAEVVVLEAGTGRTCRRSDIPAAARLSWESPHTLLIAGSEGIQRWEPCGPPGPRTMMLMEPAASAARSSEGTYLAGTQERSHKSGILYLRTTITDIARGSVAGQVDWSVDERLGDLGLGGEWIGPTTFLLYETRERGPLLLETTGEVRPVLSDPLGVSPVPSPAGSGAYTWVAHPVIGAAQPGYHLLLSGLGEEAEFPLARLLHAESGRLETLPYRFPWRAGSTPDGRWLMMDARPDAGGYETHQIWIRPLEDINGQWTLLADRPDSDTWAPDMDSYAWQRGTHVVWQAFPSGAALSEWDVSPYAARPASISPDGCRLAAEGVVPGEWRAALFVWDRCPK
jgi:hypothetical protein